MTWTVLPHKHKLTAPHHDFFIDIDFHDGVFFMPPPVPPVAGKSWHIGIGYMGMSNLSGEEKHNDKKVLADGVHLCSRSAEVKRLILPHINIGPFFIAPNPNLLIPLLILGSSSKHMFAAGSVKGKDGSIACTFIPSCYVGVGLNQACADPCGMPTSIVVMHGTVFVGMTLADFFIGLFLIIIDIAIDLLLGWICDKTGKKLKAWLMKKTGAGNFLRTQMKKLLKGGVNPWFRPLSKKFLGGEASFIRAYTKKGTKGFQSLADDYVEKGAEKILGEVVEAVTGVPMTQKGLMSKGLQSQGLDSGGVVETISEWMLGNAEAF